MKVKSQKSSVRKHFFLRNSYFVLSFFLFSLFLTNSSCKKDEIIPIVTNDTLYDNTLLVSDTPLISLVSIAPEIVQQYADSIIITISYLDGGGDLGDSDASAQNLFVVDSRNSITYKYRIPQLAPTGSDINVKGQFSVLIPNTVITDGSTSQMLTYSIYIKDRAGNLSNTIQTPQIQVVE